MLHEELKSKGNVSTYEYVDLLKAEYLNPEQLKKFQQEETIRRISSALFHLDELIG